MQARRAKHIVDILLGLGLLLLMSYQAVGGLHKNGILLTHCEFSGCHFVFPPLDICADS